MIILVGICLVSTKTGITKCDICAIFLHIKMLGSCNKSELKFSAHH